VTIQGDHRDKNQNQTGNAALNSDNAGVTDNSSNNDSIEKVQLLMAMNIPESEQRGAGIFPTTISNELLPSVVHRMTIRVVKPV
jgi:hypothetical protein